tara:strand:- start:32013 stop:32678 length:666 start_codon:yes stop_codon:yes gene_type:complete
MEDSITDKNTEENIVNGLKVAADPADISPEDRKKNVKRLAGAISHALRTSGEVDVRAFGNAAIGKACKALSIAKDFIEETHNLQLSYSPAFLTIQVEGSTLTGIKFCTFTSEKTDDKDLDEVKSVLMVKADPKDIDSQDRRLKVRKLAGAIAHAVEENKECVVRAFGNAAISKACKALSIARGFTATRGPDLYCYNQFIMTKMGDNERTGIAYYVFTNELN